jgi:hypothetical protein
MSADNKQKLIDLDYEWNRISMIQSLLLLSTWYEPDNSLKDLWFYMQFCSSLAEGIGLNLDTRDQFSAHDQMVRRNVYWCLYVRDRMLALGMRRYPRVHITESQPMLEMSDFLGWTLPEDSQILAPDCVSARNMGVQETQYLMFIKQCELAVRIDRILKVQYSKLSTHTTPPIEFDLNSPLRPNTLVPEVSLANNVAVDELFGDLVSWNASLPESCAYQPLARQDPDRGLLGLQRHCLQLAYLAAVSALVRPQTLSTKPEEVRLDAGQKLKYAASRIMQLFRELDQFQFIRCLSTTSVTFLIQALTTNLQEIRGAVIVDVKTVKLETLKDFIVGCESMKKIGRLYPAAINALHFVNKGLEQVVSYEKLVEELLARMPEAAAASAVGPAWQDVDTPPPEKAKGQQFGAVANSVQPPIFTPALAYEPTWATIDSPPYSPVQHGLPNPTTYTPMMPQNSLQEPFPQSPLDGFSLYAQSTDLSMPYMSHGSVASEMMDSMGSVDSMDQYVDFERGSELGGDGLSGAY